MASPETVIERFTALRLPELSDRSGASFDITATPEDLTRFAADLDIIALRKLRLRGSLSPMGKRDWQLNATLGATAVQECVVSLEPVTTRIDTKVARVYAADFTYSEDSEAEMPGDDSIEALPEVVDLAAVAAEALALALPDFPRAEGLEPADMIAAPPGAAPLTDEAVKPFAGLADLKAKLEGGGE
ncbi:DUF177 domain-containing protein [Alphaproteobacteria bacterium KMM 3653]|uniref:DUF177 domain-containing protein n=1 Tax=Harenicola maris TaxID=2841044 RepID=A0AAP2CMB3_9RHOB|nr:DUF177 domain-containing protein [Harenicola maris]